MHKQETADEGRHRNIPSGAPEMLKLIISARRHPSMTREQFFAHLRYKHAPLVMANTEYLHHLRKYLQNHVVQPPAEAKMGRMPYGPTRERDSVIELWYDDIESLMQASNGPSYLAHIRPDELAFNRVDDLIVLFTREVPVFHTDGPRCTFKLFEFIRRNADINQSEFEVELHKYAGDLTSDATYRAQVNRRVHNLVVAGDETAIAPTSDYHAVLETWFESPEAYQRVATSAMSRARAFVDLDHSFYVLANEVAILDPHGQIEDESMVRQISN